MTQKKLKIVMVASCPFPANHGTPGAIRELAMHLLKLGHEVHVVTYPSCQEDIDVDGLIIHRANVPFYHNDKDEIVIGPSISRVLYDMFMVPLLIKVVLKHEIDIIHTHNYEASIAGVMAKWVTRRPMVYTGINSMQDELPTYEGLRPKWLMRKIGRMLDFLVPRAGNVLMVLSDELKDYLIKEIGVNEEKVLVVPPGVDLSMFENGCGEKVRQKLGILPDRKVVIYTGAFEYFQRVDLLIEAMRLVVKRYPDVILLLAGNVKNEKIKKSLFSQARDIGIEENLLLVDSVSLEDLPDYLDAADVGVIPRVSCPGYPIKLLNYMASGNAIVSFAGSAKALCHGFNGYVAENESVEDMAAGINLILSDRSLGNDLGIRAKETIDGVFDWHSLAVGTENIYYQLLDTGCLDRSKLNGVLKKSYIPSLQEREGVNAGFLKHGHIQFLQYE